MNILTNATKAAKVFGEMYIQAFIQRFDELSDEQFDAIAKSQESINEFLDQF